MQTGQAIQLDDEGGEFTRGIPSVVAPTTAPATAPTTESFSAPFLGSVDKEQKKKKDKEAQSDPRHPSFQPLLWQGDDDLDADTTEGGASSPLAPPASVQQATSAGEWVNEMENFLMENIADGLFDANPEMSVNVGFFSEADLHQLLDHVRAGGLDEEALVNEPDPSKLKLEPAESAAAKWMKEFAALNSHDPVVTLGEASGEDIDSRAGLLALDDDDDEGEELAQLKALDQCALRQVYH